MGRKHNKGPVERVAGEQRRTPRETLATPHVFLIRIGDKEERKRAITVLGEVRTPYCGFTDDRILVTREHLEVLGRERIPFETLS